MAFSVKFLNLWDSQETLWHPVNILDASILNMMVPPQHFEISRMPPILDASIPGEFYVWASLGTFTVNLLDNSSNRF